MVAPGHETGRAVLDREVVEGPHHVGDELRVGTGDGVDVVVAVQHLLHLAGPDLDAGRPAELEVRAEHVLERAEDEGVHRELVEHPGLAVQRVQPAGLESLEEVAAAGHAVEEAPQLLADGDGFVARQDPFDDCVAVVVEVTGDVGELRLEPGSDRRHVTTVPPRSQRRTPSRLPHRSVRGALVRRRSTSRRPVRGRHRGRAPRSPPRSPGASRPRSSSCPPA